MSRGAHECPAGATATASKWQLNVKDFPTKRRQPDVSSRHHAVCQASLGASTFATAGRFHVYTHGPYYQQSLGLQGHIVTDWVDWLQVCIPLMPGGLSLQMSLSLLTLGIIFTQSLFHVVHDFDIFLSSDCFSVSFFPLFLIFNFHLIPLIFL